MCFRMCAQVDSDPNSSFQSDGSGVIFCLHNDARLVPRLGLIPNYAQKPDGTVRG